MKKKKLVLFSLLLSVLLSALIMPANATGDDLWIPMRSSKVAAETQYPLLPTYKYTDDGWQCSFPDYPSGISSTTAYGSGFLYNKKHVVDGFTIKLRIDEMTSPSTSNYVAFAFSDSVNFPFWGSNGNAAHVMFQPLADGSYWFRAYINKNGVQTKVAETRFTGVNIWDEGGIFTLSVAAEGSGYAMTVNGNKFTYPFNELPGILTDGQFYPVFCMYSNNVSAQEMQFTVLEINGVKPQAPVAAPVVFKGVQESSVSDGLYNIRLVATVDKLTYDEIGFDVSAVYTQGGVQQTKDLSRMCSAVYTKLTGRAESGITAEYTAASLSGNYLMALGINDIPADIGEVTLTVRPYTKTDGIVTWGDSYNIIYSGGTLISQNKT